MGCGVSKADADGAPSLPARLNPLFLRRIEAIRRLRNSRTLNDTTPSRKVLLVHGKEDDEIYNNNSRKGSSSLHSSAEGSLSCITSEGSMGDASRTITTKEASDKEQITKDKEGREKKIVEAVTKDEVMADDGMDGDIENDEENDDEGMLSHEEGEEIFPGSPSFRVYFLENMKDDKDDGEGKDDDELNNISSQIEDAALSKDSVTKKSKKGRKRKSFKRIMIIPKGGQAAVKNLLNVRSCYSSASSTHDHTHLLTAKTAA